MKVKCPRVLLADADAAERAEAARTVRKAGFKLVEATTGPDAVELIRKEQFDVIIIDLHLSGTSGLEVLRTGRELAGAARWLMLAGEWTLPEVVQAVKSGVSDVWQKPVDQRRLKRYLDACKRTEPGLRSCREAPRISGPTDRLVGRSELWQRVKDRIWSLRDSDSAVLIQGESGTGKELVAETLHAIGLRKEKPFVPVHCGSIPESLQETELFGYEQGAFTGANHNKRGVLEACNGGTLFLDEVGLMAPPTQCTLLRFLENGELRHVGSVKARHLDVRVIAATNTDLKLAVEAGSFRADLYHRLKVIPIFLPPLRQRREDVLVLAEKFIADFCRAQGRARVTISPEAARSLVEYDWPGNVRELKHAVECALTFTRNGVIELADLPGDLQPTAAGKPGCGNRREREALLALLDECGWVRKDAALRAGVSKVTLWRRMKELGIDLPRRKSIANDAKDLKPRERSRVPM